VTNGPEALGGEDGAYVLLGRTSPPEDLGRMGKEELARRLILLVENSLKQPGQGSDKSR
jgi:hypothetical protein